MSHTNTAYVNLYLRDLDRLANEIDMIPEDYLWEARPGIINSCGVMAQHLIGNLRHFIGAGMGNTGYERVRPKEFENTGVGKELLLNEIYNLKDEMESVLQGLAEEDYKREYAFKFPFDATVEEALIHLYGHLNYHLGQINYLRRMIEEKG